MWASRFLGFLFYDSGGCASWMDMRVHDASHAAQPPDSDCFELHLTTKARYSTMPAVFAGSSWAGLHIFMCRFLNHDEARSIS